MNEQRGGFPQHIGALLERLLRTRGVAEDVERAAVFPEWAELVGPRIARVSEPVRFERTTLFVEVRSSAWLMELELMERQILARINSGRKRGKFEKIIFKMARDA